MMDSLDDILDKEVAGEVRGTCRSIFESYANADLELDVEPMLDDAAFLLGDKLYIDAGEEELRAFFRKLINEEMEKG